MQRDRSDQSSPITTSADRTRAAPIHVSGIPILSRCDTTGEGKSQNPETTTMLACFKGGQGAKAGGLGYSEHLSPTLSSAPSGTQLAPTLLQAMQVRRLTPTECARLQGFPDHPAKIPWRNKPAEECPDGPQYKAYGNSMCTKVMSWIGRRLDQHLKAHK